MRSLARFAFTLLLLGGCLAQNNNQDKGSGGHASAGGSGGSNTSGGRGGGGGSGGSGGSTTSVASGGSGGSASGGSSGGPGGMGGASSGGVASGGTSSGGTSAGPDAGRGGQGGGAGGGSGSGGAGGGSPAMGGGRGGGGSSGGGSSGSGGSGSGGAPGTGGSTAPTPCTFPSSWTVGSATYTTYTLPNPATACGYNGSNNTIKNIVNPSYFAAIPGNSSSDFNTSNRCGACIQIGSAIVTIVDECPYDGSNNPPCKANPTGHMDLSNAAANAGGVKGDPNVHGQNQWKYVPCPVTGNVIVRLKNGNDNEIFIENEIVPIAQVTCAGQSGSRTSYGSWHFGGNVPGASCDVTDIAGRKITITVGSSQGQDVDTKVQFPKCQ